jgi:hypothetical protein
MAFQGCPLAKVLPLLFLFLSGLSLGATAAAHAAGGGAHPGGAHKAAGNEVDMVDVAQHHRHQLGHEFFHRRLLIFFVVFSVCILSVILTPTLVFRDNWLPYFEGHPKITPANTSGTIGKRAGPLKPADI